MSITITARHYRFRNDDGSETSATWIGAVDTNVSITLTGANKNFRLRFALSAAAFSIASGSMSLMCSHNGGSAFAVNNASSYVAGAISTNLTDGASTTEQFTPDGGLIYKATNYGVTDNAMATNTGFANHGGVPTSNWEAEIEFSLQALNTLSSGDTLTFTLASTSDTIVQYGSAITLTISRGATSASLSMSAQAVSTFKSQKSVFCTLRPAPTSSLTAIPVTLNILKIVCAANSTFGGTRIAVGKTTLRTSATATLTQTKITGGTLRPAPTTKLYAKPTTDPQCTMRAAAASTLNGVYVRVNWLRVHVFANQTVTATRILSFTGHLGTSSTFTGTPYKYFPGAMHVSPTSVFFGNWYGAPVLGVVRLSCKAAIIAAAKGYYNGHMALSPTTTVTATGLYTAGGNLKIRPSTKIVLNSSGGTSGIRHYPSPWFLAIED